jgi:NAD+ synthase
MDYQNEIEKRVKFIKDILKESGAKGIIFGNSGGKDCALAGILCKMACEDTVGIMMPCESTRNFGEDLEDGRALSQAFGIDNRMVDLTASKKAIIAASEGVSELSSTAISNIAPRLRMTTLYLIGQSENRLVAGTGNASERYMGYFTKWGDGAYDFNPISDLTATEIYPLLRYLHAPENIINKAPSAGLFEGQTDESEMGVTYQAIDQYIRSGEGKAEDIEIIHRYHSRTEHKRKAALNFK